MNLNNNRWYDSDDDDDDDSRDDQKRKMTTVENNQVIALTHYTSLNNLITILKEGKLKAGGIFCPKMIDKCRNAIYFTVLFDFHLQSHHKPDQYLLVFSPKLLEKYNSYFLNSGIQYGNKGNNSFNPIEFNNFRAQQIEQFNQLEIKSPYGQNEAVFLLEQLDLDEYLLEIRIIPYTRNSSLRYSFVVDELKKNMVPQRYIDRVVDVNDLVVRRPSFSTVD